MQISKDEFETCECCGDTRRVFKSKYVCDTCGKILRDYGQDNDGWLGMTVFYGNGEYHERDYCSWKCCFKGVEKFSNTEFDFISMPYLHKNKDHGIADILDFLKDLENYNKTENL